MLEQNNKQRSVMWTWVLWGVYILFVIITKALDPIEYKQVFLVYRDAALNWVNTQPLYDGSNWEFIYLPQSAILAIPFAQMPALWGSILWRLVNMGVFALGVYQFCRLADRTNNLKLFLPVTLVSILMSASAAKLGQMTVIMAGLMLIAMMDLVNQKWWRAAFWLTLAFAFKPLAIVLILLVLVLFPRTILPLVMFFTVFTLAPFLMQDPGYVWQQYQNILSPMQQIATYDMELPFAQLFWAMRSIEIYTPGPIQTAVRVLFAVMTLGYCWWLQRQQAQQTFAVYLYTISTCYLLLFNPRTENNTYAMLAPALGVFAVWSFQTAKKVWGYGYSAIIITYLLSNRIGKWLIGGVTMWLKPLLCVVFLIFVLLQSRAEHDKDIATDL